MQLSVSQVFAAVHLRLASCLVLLLLLIVCCAQVQLCTIRDTHDQYAQHGMQDRKTVSAEQLTSCHQPPLFISAPRPQPLRSVCAGQASAEHQGEQFFRFFRVSS